MKKCIACNQEKELSEYYTHPQMSDGHLGKCKGCCRQYQHDKDTRAYDSHRYRNNIRRYLSTKYFMMKSRCNGNGHQSYLGREVLAKAEWDKWCDDSYPTFISLYINWQASDYQKRLAPSIDRIDNNKGYVLGNLQWLTQAANTSKFTK